MPTDSANDNGSPTHGHSGEGAASIVPHLPADRQEQQSQLPKAEEPPVNENPDGDTTA